MNRVTLTTVKADARIQRCAINDPFKSYTPESETRIGKFRVEENETLRQLNDAFKQFRLGGIAYDQDYKMIISLIKGLNYSSKDVLDISVILAAFQGDTDFGRKAGIFLSALVNNHPEKEGEFTIVTENFDRPLDLLGLYNTKHLTIRGDAGTECGKNNEGTITVKGNVGWACGDFNGGAITVDGDTSGYCGPYNGGTITVNGNVGVTCGFYNSGAINVKGSTDHSCGGFNRGRISIEGNTGKDCGNYSKGIITVNGNAGELCGDKNEGTIIVKGEIASLSQHPTGDIYRKGKLTIWKGRKLFWRLPRWGF